MNKAVRAAGMVQQNNQRRRRPDLLISMRNVISLM